MNVGDHRRQAGKFYHGSDQGEAQEGTGLDIQIGAAAPGRFAIAASRKPTLQQFQHNVARLLKVESDSERERARSREALVHAGKMAAVGRMVASVNHEIKRPLASMQLLVENAIDLIAHGDVDSAAENLSLLLRATGQMSELSRQLEGFSRKTPLKCGKVSVREAVEHACAVVSPKVKTGRRQLLVRVGNHPVLADFDRLTLALVNLIDNALDAAAGVQDQRIEIESELRDGAVAILVRDHGAGIAAHVMENLFDAFFTTKPPGEGLGLGLALSSEVIDEMGGALSARNHPQGGAEFCIVLPAAESAA
ncbi:sensor histidine kinase [Massilia sp. BJB1822]|uniref:sensor histidine kinase n=1 Tax=Massilia sp. BJB1822 TaxID=2744470 RepID=UPI0015949D0A|nr:ATP-binding protein [Massilia sp. BJB1822]NVE00130.1 GHKL domain-containing protein [Massilia sp. BJB1822]